MKTNKMCAILGNLHRYQELMPLTENRPLSTLLFDCKYRLIDFNLSSIENASIKQVYMIFNEGETQSVFDHIGGGKEWNLDGVQNRFFIHLFQDSLKQQAQGEDYYYSVIDYLEKSKSENTVFMGSKILCNIDLRALLKIHQVQKNEMTVVYKRINGSNVSDSDLLFNVNSQGHLEEAIQAKKGTVDSLVNLCTDIFIIKTDRLIEALKEGQKVGATPNLGQFLREMISIEDTGLYEYTGYLSNIYDIPSYYQTNMDMLDVHKYTSLLYSNQKIYTKLKNEVPTYYSATSDVQNSHFASGCIVEGSVEDSLIARRTTIHPKAKVKGAIIFGNNEIKAGAEVSYAILDKNVVIAEGIKVQGTKEAPVVIKKNTYITEDIIGGVGA
ncbi:glucose-1-phosphate adenylyltransferase, GlgD subunit [Enterococcus sp. 8G7_MSG3316]|uniref:Glucose-1-phosphate adenylyltransferase, GlgD subunit n=1 Tax=Candidatus Enterococcus testudinis TaxID=1834191 RepID=A0A242A795_9ENTE|nr:glucose-1-phosphate adenylyltransferase subunit GlgD [Enterococcus sp. 8G7_MSG3316]OTN76917.1 glucose-1-phosphate adenylyltransferase, GlgD subunit [Enterococcus sp. 8G7_MSG3316]